MTAASTRPARGGGHQEPGSGLYDADPHEEVYEENLYDDGQDGTRGSRAARFTVRAGAAAGTVLAVLDEWCGVRVRIRGMPPWLGYAAGFAAVWLIAAGLAVWAAVLLRRHHRAMARAAGRAAVRAGQAGAARGGWLAVCIHARAARRWRRRGPAGRDAFLVPVTGDDAGRRWILHGRDQDQGGDPEHDGQDDGAAPGLVTDPCDVCGAPGGEPCRPGCKWAANGPSPAGAPAAPEPNREAAMTTDETADETGPMPRSWQRMEASRCPPRWRVLANDIADYRPDDDADFLDWFSGSIGGTAAVADGFISAYETCIDEVGIDPVAIEAVHDAAEVFAEAATQLASAKKKFMAYYAEVREHRAQGKTLPHNAREWITGEDA